MDRDTHAPNDPPHDDQAAEEDPTSGQDGEDLPFPGAPAASGPITANDVDGEGDDR